MRLPLILALAALPVPAAAAADEVVVFAAASLKTALDAVAADFTAETGHQVTLSYAGSSQLAAQIIAGAPADVFVSAAVSWMDAVASEGLIVADSRTDLVGNTLVLIGPAGAPPMAPADLPAALGNDRLAMALVDSVPAGQYGKAALQSLGLWDAVAPHVAQADNVRAALALVALGEAPFGIVYATDAAAEPGVSVVATFAADSHPPIVYPAALLTGAADAGDRAFLEALSGPAADAIFSAQGFALLD